MKRYKLKEFITHDVLVDIGFTYRKHFQNYMLIDSTENYETHQDLCIQVNLTTKDVDIYIHTLNQHRNVENVKSGGYNLQADIFPHYFEVINRVMHVLKEADK